jgi:hypothetical protein
MNLTEFFNHNYGGPKENYSPDQLQQRVLMLENILSQLLERGGWQVTMIAKPSGYEPILIDKPTAQNEIHPT